MLREPGAMATYVQKDLGECEAGQVIEITPAQHSNVVLLDEENYDNYRRGRRVRGVGGPTAAGVPIQLSVFHTGRWFAVVERTGGRGKIQASMRRLETAAIDADSTETVPTKLAAEQLLGDAGR